MGVVLFTSQPSASQPFTSHSVHFYSQGKYPIHSHRTCTHFTCIFAYIWLKSTPWKIKSTFHFLLCFSSSKGTLKVQKVHLKYSLTKRIYIFFIYSFNESTIYYPEYCKTNLLYFFIKHCKTNIFFSLTIPCSHITNFRFFIHFFYELSFLFLQFSHESFFVIKSI